MKETFDVAIRMFGRLGVGETSKHLQGNVGNGNSQTKSAQVGCESSFLNRLRNTKQKNAAWDNEKYVVGRSWNWERSNDRCRFVRCQQVFRQLCDSKVDPKHKNWIFFTVLQEIGLQMHRVSRFIKSLGIFASPIESFGRNIIVGDTLSTSLVRAYLRKVRSRVEMTEHHYILGMCMTWAEIVCHKINQS